MPYQQWIKTVLISFFTASILLIGVNYTVDPMQQYRMSSFYPVYYKPSLQRYINAGLAKNYDYKSIVLGTSHTENFIISNVEKNLNFTQTVKLSISGGTAREQSITLQTAIENNKNLINVLWGLDLLSFYGPSAKDKSQEDSFPMYLYDKKFSNDYRYYYSLDTLKRSLKALSYPMRKAKDDPLFSFDHMYQWQHRYKTKFTIEHILKSYKKNKEKYSNKSKENYTLRHFKISFDLNFLNTLKNNPQISFKIFFPPYSLLHYKLLEENIKLADIIDFKRYIVNQLSSLPNVTLYDFQIESKITANLNNYRDTSHYHQNINTWMLEEMKMEKYIVSKKSIDENIKIFEEQIANYSFDINKKDF